MKLLRILFASAMTLSMAGCCCGRNIVSDPCDPCSGMMGQGCGLSRFWWGRNMGCGCNSCACGDVVDCGTGCAGCGAPSGMYTQSSGGCGCGQAAYPGQLPAMNGSSSPIMGAPPYNPSPTPAQNSNSIPVPPETPPVPAPTNESTTMIPPSPSLQTQTVTYEEFQRLPGTIISGPGAVMGTNGVPAVVQQASAVGAPRPSATVQNQQAVWTNAKGY